MSTQKSHRDHQHGQRQRIRQRKTQRQRKKRQHRQRQEARNLVFRLRKTIDQHFPDLYERLRQIPDCRQAPDYRLVEILMAGLCLFLFKKGSRHALNDERADPVFRRNYARLFKVRLPHMDTVDAVLQVLDESHLERLKVALVQGLLAKKIFRRQRLFATWYQVAIDGTHVMDVPEGHCAHCLHQTFKNGHVRYFHHVLEAKLVTANGFCLSLATEWIENPDEYAKQDCELTAFHRLAAKLKAAYPRLKLCLLADGLYPNQTFFRLCQAYGWMWIVTLKDGSLWSVWKQVLHRQGQTRCRKRRETSRRRRHLVRRIYEWFTQLTYLAWTVHWWQCTEVVEGQGVTRFVFLTNLDAVTPDTLLAFTTAGRLRWKIENVGFDVQKHHGYGLGHQFSRTSMQAMKNYYQLLQIAHLCNQLFELGSLFTTVRRRRESLAHVWQCLVGELRQSALDVVRLAVLLTTRIRIRYD